MVSFSAPQRYQLARQAGFTPQDAVTATAISLAENGSGDPALPSPPNKDGSVDLGLWQINQAHWPAFGGRAALEDGLTNAKAAFSLFTARHGFDDWVTFTTGVWRAHLPEARAAAQQAEAGGVDLTPTIGSTAPSSSPVSITTGVPIGTLAGSTSSAIASAAQQSEDVATSNAQGITGAVQNAAKGIGSLGSGVSNFLALLSKAIGALFDTRMWWRVLLVLLGIAAVIIGLVLYIRPSVQDALKVAAAAA